MAAASLGSGGTFIPTQAQTLYVNYIAINETATEFIEYSEVYAAVVLSHAVLCCLGTAVLARLQSVYVVLNVMCVYPPATCQRFDSTYSLIPLDVQQALSCCDYCSSCSHAEGIQK